MFASNIEVTDRKHLLPSFFLRIENHATHAWHHSDIARFQETPFE
jgi:hypothetical protein